LRLGCSPVMPPDQLVHPLRSKTRAEIDPASVSQEEREIRLFRCTGQENGNHGLLLLDGELEQGPHLLVFPRPQAIGPDEYSPSCRLLDALLQERLPGPTWD
jgi:hypothetical protein